jgi:polyhydroxybutyrate depolymerase
MNRTSPFAFLAFALLAGCSVPSDKLSLTTPDHRERVYRLYVPPTLPSGPRPLVVVLHGGGGSGRQMERFLELDALAEKEGFLVAYPSGLDNGWNDGRETDKVQSQADHVDDGAFIAAMLDEIARQHAVDAKRIYATGISNGGFFAHYLANRFPDRFAAIAPVVGGIAPLVAADFGKGAVAVLIIQGTEDPLVPYGGGDVARDRGKLIDTVAAARLWAKRNGCVTESGDADEPDVDHDDGCKVRRRVWLGGEAPVVLRSVVGGGHTWPGGSQYFPKSVIGAVCRDFDATKDIWEFFKANPKK